MSDDEDRRKIAAAASLAWLELRARSLMEQAAQCVLMRDFVSTRAAFVQNAGAIYDKVDAELRAETNRRLGVDANGTFSYAVGGDAQEVAPAGEQSEPREPTSGERTKNPSEGTQQPEPGPVKAARHECPSCDLDDSVSVPSGKLLASKPIPPHLLGNAEPSPGTGACGRECSKNSCREACMLPDGHSGYCSCRPLRPSGTTTGTAAWEVQGVCMKCGGSGKDWTPDGNPDERCTVCNGTGRMTKRADNHGGER